MRSTFSLLPYINRSKVKADGTTAVLCRITIDGKQTVISPGIYCRPEDWNGREERDKVRKGEQPFTGIPAPDGRSL